MQQLRSDTPFTAKFLWIWAGITVVVTVIGLCRSVVWHTEVRRQQIWRMGIYDRVDCRFLAGTTWYYYWSFCRRIYRGDDREQ